MVDFRYHALSLVAVFLALGIGIVLGVTVGDSLVSDADRNLRESLREDVTDAREEVRSEQELADRREDAIEEMAPDVAARRLAGRRIALVGVGDLPVEIADSVNEAIELGGGDLVRRAELDLAPEARNEVPEPDMSTQLRAQRRWGAMLARFVESGRGRRGRLARAVAPFIKGNLRGAVDAVVVYRDPPAEDDEDAALREAFSDGILHRMRDIGIGVEALDTDPSQVGTYREAGIEANVDNVETAAGRLALVLLIADRRREGSFGYKDSAERVLPELD